MDTWADELGITIIQKMAYLTIILRYNNMELVD
jgi:predicted DNA-binding protein (UPF0278 family)